MCVPGYLFFSVGGRLTLDVLALDLTSMAFKKIIGNSDITGAKLSFTTLLYELLLIFYH